MVDTPIAEDKVAEDELDWEDYEANLYTDFSFVILISTKNYEGALKRAHDAASTLGYPLDLRELEPNDEIGLSLPLEKCEAICHPAHRERRHVNHAGTLGVYAGGTIMDPRVRWTEAIDRESPNLPQQSHRAAS